MKQTSPRLSIAIDGPAGAGKSTTARMLAKDLNIVYVDSGAMYRTVAWTVLHDGIAPSDTEAVSQVAAQVEIRFAPPLSPDGPQRVYAGDTEITSEIRTPEISQLASSISVIPAVREALVAQQRRVGESGGVVMEGRDIGTVVLPKADVKVFLTASLEERARRRYAEFKQRGDNSVTFEAVHADIAERDRRDSTREVSPLSAAADAITLDSENMSARQVVDFILELCAKHV